MNYYLLSFKDVHLLRTKYSRGGKHHRTYREPVRSRCESYGTNSYNAEESTSSRPLIPLDVIRSFAYIPHFYGSFHTQTLIHTIASTSDQL